MFPSVYDHLEITCDVLVPFLLGDLLFSFLFILKAERQRVRRVRKYLPSTGLLLHIQVTQMSGRGPKDLGHYPLLFQMHQQRELDQKWNRQNSNLCSNVGCQSHRWQRNPLCHDAVPLTFSKYIFPKYSLIYAAVSVTHIEIFHPLLYSPDGQNSQHWARLMSGARLHLDSPNTWRGPKPLCFFRQINRDLECKQRSQA